jgi:hypothetical protein
MEVMPVLSCGEARDALARLRKGAGVMTEEATEHYRVTSDSWTHSIDPSSNVSRTIRPRWAVM